MRRDLKTCDCGEPTDRFSGQCAMCETDEGLFEQLTHPEQTKQPEPDISGLALSAPAAGQSVPLTTGQILALERRARMSDDEAIRYARTVESLLSRNTVPTAAGQDVSALVEALDQTRIDLVILRGSFAQAAKYDHKAEGMDYELGKWIGRIDAALAAHKAGGSV